MQISPNCRYSNSFVYKNNTSLNSVRPAFGSVVVSRVLLREVNRQGDIFYTPLLNNEKGIVGIYQSLARRISDKKYSGWLKRLAEVIPDLNTNDPIIRSTIIGSRSSFKRFILTGVDAKQARDYGSDLIGVCNNRAAYSDFMKNTILNNPKRRVFDVNNNEIGLDLIVEGNYRGRKLVDVEVSTLANISRAKKPVYAATKANIEKLDNILQKESEQPKYVNGEFGFLKTVDEEAKKPKVYRD